MIKIPYKVPTLALSLGAALICAAPGSPMAGAAVDLSTAVTSPSGTIFVIPSGNCFVQEGGAPFNVAIGITHNGSGSCITGTGGCTDVDAFALFENDPTLARGVDDSGANFEPDSDWDFKYVVNPALGAPSAHPAGHPAFPRATRISQIATQAISLRAAGSGPTSMWSFLGALAPWVRMF
jgi:hypothetical protein